MYKVNYTDEYQNLPQRPRMPILENLTLSQLYKGRLPIKYSKYKHLQEINDDEEVHNFYDSIPCKLEKENDPTTQNKYLEEIEVLQQLQKTQKTFQREKNCKRSK